MLPGLYIHVPFCRRKCRYCDFASQPTDTHSDAAAAAFLDAMEKELAGLPPDFRPGTVYIGGGTPTALDEPSLARLLDAIRRRADLSAVREWTCEANPGTLDAEKAGRLRAGGVNRVSLGAQTFRPDGLKFLGRIHEPGDVRRSVEIARAVGVGNVSLDLMYTIPGAPADSIDRDLDETLALQPDHVSAYALTIEEGEPSADWKRSAGFDEVDDEEARRQYDLIRTRLAAAGFVHYEISNWARPGRESQHNLVYWSGGDYIGIGPSAHSHWRGARYGNLAGLDDYIRELEAGRRPVEFEERLPPEKSAREFLVFALRRLAGVSAAEFREHTGFDLDALCGTEIDSLAARGLMQRENETVRLAPDALFVSDTVFAELV